MSNSKGIDWEYRREWIKWAARRYDPVDRHALLTSAAEWEWLHQEWKRLSSGEVTVSSTAMDTVKRLLSAPPSPPQTLVDAFRRFL